MPFDVKSAISDLTSIKETLSDNFADLQNLFTKFQENLDWYYSPGGYEKLRSAFTKLLHNYSVSAKTFIERTQTIRKQLHPHLQNKVIGKIEMMKIDYPLSFIKDLANFIQHHKMPGFALSFFSPAGKKEGVHNQKIHLDKSQLLGWENWSASSKKFLKESGWDIDIQKLCLTHHKKIQEFYDFFIDLLK